jgi:hypothetical protein
MKNLRDIVAAPSPASVVCLLALTGFALLGSGCVTVGYDFLKQQATVTVNPPTKGYAK